VVGQPLRRQPEERVRRGAEQVPGGREPLQALLVRIGEDHDRTVVVMLREQTATPHDLVPRVGGDDQSRHLQRLAVRVEEVRTDEVFVHAVTPLEQEPSAA
jgi:hypothetical protein